jgi:hypothetical protein
MNWLFSFEILRLYSSVLKRGCRNVGVQIRDVDVHLLQAARRVLQVVKMQRKAVGVEIVNR